ncbi:adenylyltransferase/cytidyltransferase family protein [archaeon]|jgi:FAD synthetase|nr:adenylyltransferase/cytidyltransferase family protein [archaeon]MBT6762225.1 adenylyltransferase/cytidyltransferase family protein [archaeon]
MKTVLVAGKFDLVHPGHLKFFEEAKSNGDRLIVVVARDSTITKNTGVAPIYPEDLRKEFLEALSVVDQVELGNESNEMQIILEIRPDIICLGYDQPIKEERVQKFIKENKLNIKIKRLNAFNEKLFKSSKIKSQVRMSKSEVLKEFKPTGVSNKDQLDSVPVIVGDYDEIADWEMDPKGYFLIRINKEKQILELAHCKELGIIDCIFEGKKPQDIYFEIHKAGIVSRIDHAAYIGKELHKAYLALQKSTNYTQDSELEI